MVYVIIKPIVSYYYIKANNEILKYGIEGEAKLIEAEKSYRIPYHYFYTVQFYLYQESIKISSKIPLYTLPGNKNEIMKIKYWEKYPNKVYICNLNYKYTYIIWIIEIMVLFIVLVVMLLY